MEPFQWSRSCISLKSLYWPIMAHQVLKLLQQKPQQCGVIKTVEFIWQVAYLLLVTFEADDNYSIQFEMKKTLFAQHYIPAAQPCISVIYHSSALNIGFTGSKCYRCAYIAVHACEPISELQSVTCHMRSHSVACRPTQVNAPRLNHSHAGRYSIYLPRRDGRLSWPR